MNDNKYPPHITAGDCVILFDGVCKLCSIWSQFIIKYDTQGRFKLCSVQSPEGQSILRYFDMPTGHFDTMLYVEGNQCFDKSDAFLNVIRKFGYPWRLLYVFKILPKCIRNWFYDRIALNRYSLFGKYDTCVVPSKENENRFIKNESENSS
ncbi:thiol-disulfide oxidoreductase DCC family protein [Pseudocolwellia sp. AS88]|uniref:thiol-disulfide oxidoreductase DCC family protein n=1 Tax=Pseudocolwellia sp. AS88 TaxID=3063958 RepID=UPI0026EC8946|nr:thiol-disulfide oxidoreductase DCC family protein [Pseudocolwellia sp. AS88]MDO7084547.1 thiol-disulfide oxidoreductase DCC family protein [Pseudocolwellia sp. AS88]